MLKLKLKLKNTMSSPIYDLEDRLIKFAGDTILFSNKLPNDKAGSHLKGQVIRSSSSTALNYGEYQGAESIKDEIHKLSIVLKELKETRTNFKILAYINYGAPEKRTNLLNECEELIKIIFSQRRNKRNKL